MSHTLQHPHLNKCSCAQPPIDLAQQNNASQRLRNNAGARRRCCYRKLVSGLSCSGERGLDDWAAATASRERKCLFIKPMDRQLPQSASNKLKCFVVSGHASRQSLLPQTLSATRTALVTAPRGGAKLGAPQTWHQLWPPHSRQPYTGMARYIHRASHSSHLGWVGRVQEQRTPVQYKRQCLNSRFNKFNRKGIGMWSGSLR